MLPLSFAVDVAGIKQQATVLDDLSDMACYKYRVRFENGVEDIFTIVEGPENTIEAQERGHEHYCLALTVDLFELSKVVPENFLSVLPFKLEGEDVNVWLVEEEPDPGEDKCIMVNYNAIGGFQIYCVREQWGFREYKPTPLTKEEKEMAKALVETLKQMFDPAALNNLLAFQ